MDGSRSDGIDGMVKFTRDSIGKTDGIPMASEIYERLTTYLAAEQEVSYDTILTEFVNDDIGRLIADGDVLNQFIEENKSDRTLLQKVADALRALWQKLTGKEKAQVKNAEEALLAALKATETQAAKQARRLWA